jgi:hypothetical protein
MKVTRLICLALIPAAVAACSSHAEPTDNPPSTTTDQPKAAYIRKADAICAAVHREARSISTPSSKAEEVAALKKEAGILARAVDKLSKLHPPPGDEQVIQRRLIQPNRVLATAYARQAAAGKAALRAHDRRRVDMVLVKAESASAAPGLRDAFEFANAYGFKECAGK